MKELCMLLIIARSLANLDLATLVVNISMKNSRIASILYFG
jgi:hypothetical protein